MTQNTPKILVTSISKKVPLVRELRKALAKISADSVIVGADIDEQCIASYFVDEFWKMPPLSELTEDIFIEQCLNYGITGIIPTRDGELNYLATINERLRRHNIFLMLPEKLTVSICLDKLKFSEYLYGMKYPVIPSSMDIEQLDSQFYVVKECYGAGAKTMLLNASKQQAVDYATKLDSAIFQPFIKGDEYSIDVYFSQNTDFKGAVVRKRESVVNGESQITVTINDAEMESLCQSIGSDLQLVGHCLFQIIKSTEGSLHIVEVNTRFGGASTLSIAAGLDSFYWFALESIGLDIKNNKMIRAETQLRQVRYPMDEIFKLP